MLHALHKDLLECKTVSEKSNGHSQGVSRGLKQEMLSTKTRSKQNHAKLIMLKVRLGPRPGQNKDLLRTNTESEQGQDQSKEQA